VCAERITAQAGAGWRLVGLSGDPINAFLRLSAVTK
jgi:hypothetical protein